MYRSKQEMQFFFHLESSEKSLSPLFLPPGWAISRYYNRARPRFAGGMHGARGGGRGSGGEFGEPPAGEEVAADRGRSADARGQGAFAAWSGGQVRHASADDHRPAHLLHRGAEGDGQRGLPADRRDAVGPGSDRRRLLGRRRGCPGDRSSASAGSHPGRQTAAPRHRSTHLRPAETWVRRERMRFMCKLSFFRTAVMRAVENKFVVCANVFNFPIFWINTARPKMWIFFFDISKRINSLHASLIRVWVLIFLYKKRHYIFINWRTRLYRICYFLQLVSKKLFGITSKTWLFTLAILLSTRLWKS